MSSGRLRHGTGLDKPWSACTWKFPVCPWADGVGRIPEGARLHLEGQCGAERWLGAQNHHSEMFVHSSSPPCFIAVQVFEWQFRNGEHPLHPQPGPSSLGQVPMLQVPEQFVMGHLLETGVSTKDRKKARKCLIFSDFKDVFN